MACTGLMSVTPARKQQSVLHRINYISVVFKLFCAIQGLAVVQPGIQGWLGRNAQAAACIIDSDESSASNASASDVSQRRSLTGR